MLSAWKTWQAAERVAAGIEPAGWVFADINGNAIHPTPSPRPSSGSWPEPEFPRSASTTFATPNGTLLIKAGVPVKVVSERLGHGNPAFTIDTYQHVLPGMQAAAARIFESLIAGAR